MSLIDPLEILYSNARATKSFAGDTDSFINGVKKCLVSVGWTLTESIPSTGFIVYPFGAPTAAGPETFPKHIVGCPATPFLGVGGVQFSLFNPYSETPAVGGSCFMVPAGDTPISTLSNLASAVTLNTPFNASVTAQSPSYFIMTFTAKIGGPDFDGVFIDGNGRWATLAATQGGGFVLTSKFDPEITQYKVTLTAIPSTYGNISVKFTVGGGDGLITLTDQGTYTIVANGYGFFLRNSLGEGNYPFTNYSLFVMAPKMPAAENFDPNTTSLFILGPRTFKNFTFYSSSGGPEITALDTVPGYHSNVSEWPKLLAYRNPGTPLTAANGKPIVHAAYISFGKLNSGVSHIIGKLPDCAVFSGTLTPYGETEIEGQIYVVVSSQDGGNSNTASSLLMLAPLPAPDPVPPTPDPIYPATQPQNRNGTCNIFGVGVTALSGNFTGLATQSPITIDGIPYFILSVEDATHLTLTTATVVKEGVVWTVP